MGLRYFVFWKKELLFLALVDFVNLLLHLELEHLFSLSIKQVVLEAKLVRQSFGIVAFVDSNSVFLLFRFSDIDFDDEQGLVAGLSED